MKRFIKDTILFALFCSVFYIVILPLWSYVAPPFMAKNVRNCIGCYGHLFTRSNEAKQIYNPDILFLGSSHAYRGLDPRVFKKYGFTSFNLGSSSQTPINTKVLLHQYLDKIKPKMIVYEIYAGTLTSDGVESSLDLLSNNQVDIYSFNMTLDINNISSYNTLIYGYFRQIFGLNKFFKEPKNQNEDTYIKGGFVETSFRKNPLHKEKKGQWDINPKQISSLKENIKYIKSKNIPIILIQAPITKVLYNSKTNNKEIDSLLNNLAPYKNFYGDIPLNDSIDFYDSNHLNQKAVIKFNKRLIKYIDSLNNKQSSF